jgi:hypothetical protein
MYFPNRELLSFRVVLAFPNASMIGLLAKICRSVSLIPPSSATPARPRCLRAAELSLVGSSTEAKYRNMYFAETVLPAPLRWGRTIHQALPRPETNAGTYDSPLTTIV